MACRRGIDFQQRDQAKYLRRRLRSSNDVPAPWACRCAATSAANPARSMNLTATMSTRTGRPPSAAAVSTVRSRAAESTLTSPLTVTTIRPSPLAHRTAKVTSPHVVGRCSLATATCSAPSRAATTPSAPPLPPPTGLTNGVSARPGRGTRRHAEGRRDATQTPYRSWTMPPRGKAERPRRCGGSAR